MEAIILFKQVLQYCLVLICLKNINANLTMWRTLRSKITDLSVPLAEMRSQVYHMGGQRYHDVHQQGND